MKYKIINNTISLTKEFIKEHIRNGQVVLDATIGNGNDTLLMADRVGKNGKVYGFDIQQVAIDNTTKLLKENNLENRVTLIRDSHENLNKYITHSLDFIIYNLGYLPNGDKNIITQSNSTLKSIELSLELLNKNGLLLVNSYIGHDGGMEENLEIESMLRRLNQKEYNVLKHSFINQKNNPPILYIIERSF